MPMAEVIALTLVPGLGGLALIFFFKYRLARKPKVKVKMIGSNVDGWAQLWRREGANLTTLYWVKCALCGFDFPEYSSRQLAMEKAGYIDSDGNRHTSLAVEKAAQDATRWALGDRAEGDLYRGFREKVLNYTGITVDWHRCQSDQWIIDEKGFK
jgi:hypothetical protein